MLADPTIADAIFDRFVHNAHLFVLKGTSLRKKEDSAPNGLNPPPDHPLVASLRRDETRRCAPILPRCAR
jgi:hypothetical protein